MGGIGVGQERRMEGRRRLGGVNNGVSGDENDDDGSGEGGG